MFCWLYCSYSLVEAKLYFLRTYSVLDPCSIAFLGEIVDKPLSLCLLVPRSVPADPYWLGSCVHSYHPDGIVDLAGQYLPGLPSDRIVDLAGPFSDFPDLT
ncbi:unnamed protein product, partial [Owenia fusiformis]